MSKVSIVTVTYNSEHYIHDYLESVIELLTNNKDYSLIIVDNDSKDKTVDIINTAFSNSALSDQCVIHSQHTNAGFGSGCNTGVKVSELYKPEYIWFLNPDTIISEQSANALLNTIETKHVNIAGSYLKDENSIIRAGGFRFPLLLNVISSHLSLGIFDRIFPKSRTTYPVSKEPHLVEWATGSSFMIKKDLFNKLNGFDERYFLYFEEVDLFLRANRENEYTMIVPDSVVYHISGASTGVSNKSMRINRLPSYWFESRRRFYVKNFNKWFFTMVDFTVICSISLNYLKCLLKRENSQTAPNYIKDILKHSVLNIDSLK